MGAVVNPTHLSVCRLVGQSVWLDGVYCAKTAHWIWMAFGVMSGVDRGMGVVDGSGDRRREGAVLCINVGHPIVTSGVSAWGVAMRLFPNYFEISCFIR